MLPRSTPRVYDNISNPPPQSSGYYYGQTTQYVAGSNSSAVPACAAFKWTSLYAPWTHVSIPKWAAYQAGGAAAYRNPNDMYQEVSCGSQAVMLVSGSTQTNGLLDGVYNTTTYSTLSEDMGSQTSSTWTRVCYTNNSAVIVGFDRSKYILVPTIYATNDALQDWVGDYKSYKTVMTTYPYIYEMRWTMYYKNNLGNNGTGSQVYISVVTQGMNRLTVPYGAPSNAYNSNYQYVYHVNCSFCVSSTNGIFFRSPPVHGAQYTSALPASWKSYNANGASSYNGKLGTHTKDILHFVDRTPYDPVTGTNRDNFNSLWYADFDTATKIINSLGFIWSESRADIANYRGSATSSNFIHIAVVGDDGATTGDSWSGSDIYNNWDNTPANSDYLNTTGDILSGNIDINAPVDMSDQTDTEELQEDTDELLPTTPMLNGLGVFASYFTLTSANVTGLSDFLWNADESVIDDVINSLKMFGQNPINAIMSLRLYPFNIYDLLQSHEVSEIVLGRVETGVFGLKIPSNASTVLNLGTLYVKPKYGDFRDYAPYTSYNLYIPFIGTINLNPNDYLGKVLTIKMVVDITTGKATAILYAAGIPMQYVDGMIGVDIPITAENMGQTASAVIGAVGSIAGAALSGNAVSLAASMVSGSADVLFNDVSINKQGNVSPAASLSMPINAYMIVSRPSSIIPDNYGHTHGYACDKTAIVSTLSGYTVCHNVDTSGITATEKERNEIKMLMEGGIYL